jgi:hypothetical protein
VEVYQLDSVLHDADTNSVTPLLKAVLALVAVAVAALAVTVIVVQAFEINPGCQLFGADEKEWREGNLRLLEDVPKYPGSTPTGQSFSNGFFVADDRCLAAENAGPYKSYATFVSYRLPAGVSFDQVEAFYDRELKARGWTLPIGRGTREVQYRKGESKMTVRGYTSAPVYQFVVRYKAPEDL